MSQRKLWLWAHPGMVPEVLFALNAASTPSDGLLLACVCCFFFSTFASHHKTTQELAFSILRIVCCALISPVLALCGY